MATLPNNETAVVKGVRTTFQAMVGTLVAFIVGLGLVVWHVPGVPEAIVTYVSNNLPTVLLSVGIPSGLVAFIQGLLRKDVKNF